MSADLCTYCDTPLVPGVNRSKDHVIPRGVVGWDHPSNIVPCCLRCNQRKGGFNYGNNIEHIRIILLVEPKERWRTYLRLSRETAA